MMKVNVLIIIIFSLVCCKSKKLNINQCEFENNKGSFLYEYSSSLVFYDDMILRDPAIIFMNNNTSPNYNRGLYVLGTSIGANTSFFEKCNNKEDIIYKINSINNENRIELHESLKESKGSIIDYKEHKYKIVNLEFESIFIGNHKMSFIKDNNFTEKDVPIYLITEIQINE